MKRIASFVAGLVAGLLVAFLLAATFPGQAKDGGLVLPFCRADLSTTEGGFMCYDTATGKIRHKGEFEVIQ